MRWDNLFDDLEVQLERELNAEERDLRAEEERQRLGRLTTRTRLVSLTLGAVGPAVFRVVLTTGDTIIVRPTTLGRDWLAADLIGTDVIGTDVSADRPASPTNGSSKAGSRMNGDSGGEDNRDGDGGDGEKHGSGRGSAQCVLPFDAIAGLVLTAPQVERSLGDVNESPSAARVSERIGLPFVLRDLCRRRAAIEVRTTFGGVNGTIDRVGRDHFDLAVHPVGTLRRTPDVYQYRVIPLAHVLLVVVR
ncbi:hypothetical protein [Cryobacterium sp. MLB-32]|uniref:hypothetical protein n=1 Tax=Cryobacterium sp. MLB-32 TaxID=1529318 RepID=UPI00056983A5|nr:hypothetical protein [Cryobacterium sp. MLB-32]